MKTQHLSLYQIWKLHLNCFLPSPLSLCHSTGSFVSAYQIQIKFEFVFRSISSVVRIPLWIIPKFWKVPRQSSYQESWNVLGAAETKTSGVNYVQNFVPNLRLFGKLTCFLWAVQITLAYTLLDRLASYCLLFFRFYPCHFSLFFIFLFVFICVVSTLRWFLRY